MKHSRILILAAVLGTAACTTPPAAKDQPPQLVLEPCQADELEGLLCGTLAVYEDREARTGRKIDLKIVVAPALGEEPAPDPVFFFAGGPGDSAASNAGGQAQYFRGLRDRRDLVFVDQRGTGGSHPLQCDAPGDPDDLQGYFEPFLRTAEIRACREQLEQIADLTLYTTSIAMDDIDEVRAALGYEQINLVGGSYGTRAAQV
ncbi:MAG: alpha/beta hydrolase, partial [bacterium]|nr:alpha/beta hydrolase [bacterium]